MAEEDVLDYPIIAVNDAMTKHLFDNRYGTGQSAVDGILRAAVMDLSFANQALSIEFIAKHHRDLEKRVYPVPEAIDREIAQLKLMSMGVRIDTLTEKQQRYLASWREGT